MCPSPGVPVGSGVLVIGGNYDVFRENWVCDNWRVGFVQTWVPGWLRSDFRWPAQEETSNFDRYQGNHMGTGPDGKSLPNGLDFFWDGQGIGSCWQTDHPAGAEPLTLPACSSWAPVKRLLDDPNKLVVFSDCGSYDIVTQTLPPGCNWFDTPERPGSVGSMLDIQLVGLASSWSRWCCFSWCCCADGRTPMPEISSRSARRSSAPWSCCSQQRSGSGTWPRPASRRLASAGWWRGG